MVVGNGHYVSSIYFNANDNRTDLGSDLPASTAALQYHEDISLIYCIWCGQEDHSFILHRCPNGATFDDRVKWGLEGKKAPYLDAGLTKYSNKNTAELDLTEEDKNFLRSLHIGWK